MTDNASLADKLGALDARFRNKTPPLKEWAQAVDDLLAFLCVNAPAILTALRADQRCAELEAENARLREAVAFYAREQSWKSSGVYMSGKSQATSAEIDGGDRARKALENRDD